MDPICFQGIHAREWISPAVVSYQIHMLTDGLETANLDVIKMVDWYFVVVLNPDGYAYSRTMDRLWRKTRWAYLQYMDLAIRF